MAQKKGTDNKSGNKGTGASKKSKASSKSTSAKKAKNSPKADSKTANKKATKKTAPSSKANNKPKRGKWYWLRYLILNKVTFVLFVIAVVYIAYLDIIVRQQFDGKKWALPARVYARPLELYQGYEISQQQLISELKAAGYKEGLANKHSGTFSINGNSFQIITRQFEFSDEKTQSQPIELIFSEDSIKMIRHAVNGKSISILRLDPALIASIYPAHNEDRELIKIKQFPDKIKKTLLAVEDRSFYSHCGVSPASIIRAMWVNLKAGKAVQGGSTLTQQLVKNFYLTSERTLWRKANEAIMSLLLEAHYDKDQILEAYINEIYLGQDGKRAIHGFALASQHYFGKPLSQLNNGEIAILVGMVRGASYYDLRRHPKRANKLKNIILQQMFDKAIISKKEYKLAIDNYVKAKNKGDNQRKYPAFLDLVRQQLKKDYAEEDLRTEGLRIFTTLAPYIQQEAENSLKRQIGRYKKRKGLDGAVIVTNAISAEVLALVGGKNTQYSGFNRALNAKRQIGSLIKPIIYYTALTNPKKYNLLSKVKDEPIELIDEKGQVWSPKNYDNNFRGDVSLLDAFANSYNLPAVHTGLELGVENVVANIRKSGVNTKIKPYPSVLLGAVQFSPIEVTQLYQTFANGGAVVPIRSITAVLDKENKPLSRYSLQLEQGLESNGVYLVNHAMKQVTKTGTAKYLSSVMHHDVAGKTGTTNDLRDSWFAGFSADKLAVVWMGEDNNQTIGLTGAAGAMQVWGGFMKNVHVRPLEHLPPEGIEYYWAEKQTGLLAERHCKGVIAVPLDEKYLPELITNCKINGIKGALEKVIDWIQ